jgi:hypothetical protein
MIGFIPVVEWQKRLYDSCYPEKGHYPGNKHEHFPLSDFDTGKMGKTALGKNYANNQKDNRFHQLEELQP